MTYIRIDITINGVAIREQASKLWGEFKDHLEQHYYQAFIGAQQIGARHGQNAFLARIHHLLRHERSDWTGTILCNNECRRRSCLGHTLAISTYTRKMKAYK